MHDSLNSLFTIHLFDNLDPELFIARSFRYLLRNSKLGITIEDLIKIPFTRPLKIQRDDWEYVIQSQWASSKFIGIDALRGNSPFIAFVLKSTKTLNWLEPIRDGNENLILTLNFNHHPGSQPLQYYVHLDLEYRFLASSDAELLGKCEELLKFGSTVTMDGTVWMLANEQMNYAYFCQRYWKKFWLIPAAILCILALFLALRRLSIFG